MRAKIPITIPPGTRMLRIERKPRNFEHNTCGYSCYCGTDGYWIIWQHTTDFIHGTYLALYDSGRIDRVTVRADEGGDVHVIREGD